jgi:hypothetical protein
MRWDEVENSSFSQLHLTLHYTTAQIQRRSVGRYKPFQHLTVGRYKLITTHI